MDERDTRLIPGTKREGRAKEREQRRETAGGRKTERQEGREMCERDRLLKGERERDRRERKLDGGLGGIRPHENRALLKGV